MRYLKSALLMEMIVVVGILSFVGIYFNLYLSKLYTSNKTQREISLKLIELESTNVFIAKKLSLGYSIDDFYLQNNTLYFQNYVLLNDVDSFTVTPLNNRYKINISVSNFKIVKEWFI
jgi:hypothetical protein